MRLEKISLFLSLVGPPRRLVSHEAEKLIPVTRKCLTFTFSVRTAWGHIALENTDICTVSLLLLLHSRTYSFPIHLVEVALLVPNSISSLSSVSLSAAHQSQSFANKCPIPVGD